jgi:hypothetical protein
LSDRIVTEYRSSILLVGIAFTPQETARNERAAREITHALKFQVRTAHADAIPRPSRA